MKLLLDQNISFRVIRKLVNHFPLVEGVRDHNLFEADDRTIWEFCRRNGYTIVTFDEDLYNLTTLYGPPPKIIWLRTGNLSNDQIAELLVRFKTNITLFVQDSGASADGCLAVYMAGTSNI